MRSEIVLPKKSANCVFASWYLCCYIVEIVKRLFLGNDLSFWYPDIVPILWYQFQVGLILIIFRFPEVIWTYICIRSLGHFDRHVLFLYNIFRLSIDVILWLLCTLLFLVGSTTLHFLLLDHKRKGFFFFSRKLYYLKYER